MKKFILSITLIFTAVAGFSADYNCQNPNTTYSYSGQQFACGNSTTPGTICYYKAQGSIPPGNNVYGCDTKAPINSGLVLLIVAAIGIGSAVLYKKEKLNIA